MIQRIQTIFLFLIVVLQCLLFFFPIAKFIGPENIEHQTEYQLLVSDYWALAVLVIISCIAPAISIFYFKKRTIQMRINIFNGIILLATQIYMIYYILTLKKSFIAMSIKIPAIFPLLSFILTFLAVRAIFKDELIIKALDRIR